MEDLFYNLFNKRYDISLDFSKLDIREECRNYNYYRLIQKQEVKETLKMMSKSKTVGSDNISIEVWKILGDWVIQGITKFFNEIMR